MSDIEACLDNDSELPLDGMPFDGRGEKLLARQGLEPPEVTQFLPNLCNASRKELPIDGYRRRPVAA